MSSNSKLQDTSSTYQSNSDTKYSSNKMNQNNLFTKKNRILTDLTRAIQLVQKNYLENEKGDQQQPISNSDYCVHELCQQFDNMFLFGLKKVEEGYWKLVIEFTHRNVLSDLKRLLNVNTSFGMGRAWIYHALNDNLIESYLKCFLENKKLVLKYYMKEQTLLMDEQITSVLITLVSGLENVEFKLNGDVPYLDYSCWPTHFNVKRYVVDSILNASPGTISQLANLNHSLQNEKKNSELKAVIAKTSQVTITKSNKKNVRKSSVLGTSANSQRLHVNNISFDDSPESSTNNLGLDRDSLSTCGSESGRFTATNNTVSPANSENAGLTLKSSEYLSDKNFKEFNLKNNGSEFDNYNNESNFKSIINVETFNRTNSTSSIDYENEIDKLRRENNMNIENSNILVENRQLPSGSKLLPKTLSKIKHSATDNSLNEQATRANPDQDLAESSLTISKSFDIKIKHLENSLKTIENATLNMDAFVNDMTSVYQDYDKLCNDSQGEDEMIYDNKEKNSNETQNNDLNMVESVVTSVYDIDSPIDNCSKSEAKVEENRCIDSLSSNKMYEHENTSGFEDTVSMQSLNQEASNLNNDINTFTSHLSEAPQADMNTSDYLAKFDLINNNNNIKQEIKVDNNTKLMIIIQIFEHGEDEKLVKFYHATVGHSQGEIENIFLLISSYGLYILVKNQVADDDTKLQKQTDEASSFKKEAFIHQKQIDYIEVSLEAQAVHLVCFNKRLSQWFTFASRSLSEHFIENLQIGRQMNQSLKPSMLSVFREATQQKLSIKKFIAKEENTTNNEVDLKCYSLVFWEDQTSSMEYLIHKEGVLWFLNKNSSSGAATWKKAYFVLKNNVLIKYRNSTDKKPLQVIKLNGEEFEGCRRNKTLSRPNTIELILSNANVVYLSAKTTNEASDWLQCFCKIISLGNLHTDQASNSCLPCCSIITSRRCYFCHEDLNTGFYRLLEVIRFEEVNRISYDNENPYFCILHDDADEKRSRYWFVYFMDELERNTFIKKFKESWDPIFQVPLTIEKCKSSELKKQCLRSIQILHKAWCNVDK